tara:strand:- start:1532 stop:1891 length:360 start_codon:yes stop_codon:yes gene_type:complete
MKLYKKVFYFLLLIPIFVLVYEIRTTLIETREAQDELFLLNAQRASNQRTIMGLQVRMLHYAENHEERMGGCPLCFKNMLMEKYDHELIRKFLRENGVNVQNYMDGELSEEDLKILTGN